MITQTVTVTEKNAPNIIIGRRGTYNTEEIVFDLTYLVETFGSGSAVMMVKRPMDNTAYPAVTEQDGSALTWTVSDTDTNFKGHGECELFWYVDDGLAKSLIWPLTILRDIGTTTEEPPEPYQTWVDDLTALGAETLQNAQSAAQSATSAGNAKTAAEIAQGKAEDAQEAAEAAQEFLENASATATTLPPSSSATASYSDGVFTFGIPKGDEGDPGDPATNLVTSVNGETGAVVLDATDVGAYVKPSGGIPKTDLASAVQTSLGKADTALQTAPVTSVNTQTGDVVLDAGDIGYESTTVEEELGTINSALTSLQSVTEIIDTASGAIASFPDGSGLPMRSLVAEINPVQDLHGYDAPWAGGAGKNLLPMTLANIKAKNTDGTWNGNTYNLNGLTFAVVVDGDGNVDGVNTNGTASADTDFNIYSGLLLPAGSYALNGCPSGGSATTYRIFSTNIGGDIGNGITGTLDGVKTTTCFINIKSGTNVNNLVFEPMIRLSSVTDATFAPYENLCPISGWTGLTGQRTGFNVWDEETRKGYYSSVTGDFVNDGSTTMANKNPVSVKPSTTYYLKSSTYTLILFCYDKDMNFISVMSGKTNNTFTTPSNCAFVNFCNGYGSGETYNHDISINYPSTDTSYHAYTGEAISVSWQDDAGTVYGGTATYNGDGTWTLVVDHAIVDLGTLTWNKVATLTAGKYRQYSTNLVGYVKAVARNNELASITCETYPAKTADQTYGCTFGISINTSANVLVYDEMYSGENDSDAFTDSVSGVKLAYPVVNPQTYTITTGELIETLVGQNNVWVDTGDVTVTYQASIKGYIDKVLAS